MVPKLSDLCQALQWFDKGGAGPCLSGPPACPDDVADSFTEYYTFSMGQGFKGLAHWVFRRPALPRARGDLATLRGGSCKVLRNVVVTLNSNPFAGPRKLS